MEGYPLRRDPGFEELLSGALGYLAAGPIADALVKATEPTLRRRPMLHSLLRWTSKGRRTIGLVVRLR